jgi:hypothetical protein
MDNVLFGVCCISTMFIGGSIVMDSNKKRKEIYPIDSQTGGNKFKMVSSLFGKVKSSGRSRSRSRSRSRGRSRGSSQSRDRSSGNSRGRSSGNSRGRSSGNSSIFGSIFSSIFGTSNSQPDKGNGNNESRKDPGGYVAPPPKPEYKGEDAPQYDLNATTRPVTESGRIKMLAANEILRQADKAEWVNNQPVNGIKGRWIKILNTNIVCMHISKVIVSTSKNDNIAFGKPAQQSSNLDNTDKYKASQVVNNDATTYNHTSCGDAPWVLIDLQFEADITKIIVVNRQDCCQQRLNGSIVEIRNEKNDTVWESEIFVDKQGNNIPVYDSNANQYGYDRFIMNPPNTSIEYSNNNFT